MASIPVHRLRISRGPIAVANCYEAIVSHVAYLGPFMQISVKIGDLTLETHQPSTAEIETLQAGDRVFAGFDRADVILIRQS